MVAPTAVQTALLKALTSAEQSAVEKAVQMAAQMVVHSVALRVATTVDQTDLSTVAQKAEMTVQWTEHSKGATMVLLLVEKTAVK